MGVRVVDSSVGGLGGCPYARNATGNVATEKVLDFLQRQNVETVSVYFSDQCSGLTFTYFTYIKGFVQDLENKLKILNFFGLKSGNSDSVNVIYSTLFI